MILSDGDIKRRLEKGDLVVEPLDDAAIWYRFSRSVRVILRPVTIQKNPRAITRSMKRENA